jgi:hypothetical protein
MKKTVLGLLVALLLAACSQQATPTKTPEGDMSAQASWQGLGGAIDATVARTPLNVTMLLDRTEKPVVASLEDDNKGNTKVYLQKWTGTAWQSFAPSMIVARSSTSFDFQIDLNNRPVVAVTKTTSSGLEDVVYRYENNTWKQLGDPSNAPNLSPLVDLVIAPNGNIFTLVQDTTLNKSYIRRWTGATWQTLYTFQKVTTYNSETFSHGARSLLFTKTSRPVVTWQLSGEEWPYAATPDSYVEVWNDSSWTTMGGIWGGRMILDKKDKILHSVIARQESSAMNCGMSVSQGENSLTRLDDTDGTYDIAVDPNNRPIVAYDINCTPNSHGGWDPTLEDSQIDLVVKRWSVSSWQTLGGVVDRVANRGAYSVALAVDSKNTIYSLFTQCATANENGNCANYNLYLSKYVP